MAGITGTRGRCLIEDHQPHKDILEQNRSEPRMLAAAIRENGEKKKGQKQRELRIIIVIAFTPIFY